MLIGFSERLKKYPSTDVKFRAAVLGESEHSETQETHFDAIKYTM